MPAWEEVITRARTIDDHYAMREPAQKYLFTLAMALPKGAVIVELGVANGKTAAILAMAAMEIDAEYIGIDVFPLGTSEVRRSLDTLGLHYTLLASHTHTAPWDASKKIDLLIIDAGHDEANVGPDCKIWLPRVKSGGIVVFDDWYEDPTKTHCHWAVGYYGRQATQGWIELDPKYTDARIFQKP